MSNWTMSIVWHFVISGLSLKSHVCPEFVLALSPSSVSCVIELTECQTILSWAINLIWSFFVEWQIAVLGATFFFPFSSSKTTLCHLQAMTFPCGWISTGTKCRLNSNFYRYDLWPEEKHFILPKSPWAKNVSNKLCTHNNRLMPWQSMENLVSGHQSIFCHHIGVATEGGLFPPQCTTWFAFSVFICLTLFFGVRVLIIFIFQVMDKILLESFAHFVAF